MSKNPTYKFPHNIYRLLRQIMRLESQIFTDKWTTCRTFRSKSMCMAMLVSKSGCEGDKAPLRWCPKADS